MPHHGERSDLPTVPVPVAAGAVGCPPLRGVRPTFHCPACGATRRGRRDPRGPVGLTPDALGWRCHRCGASGDGLAFIRYTVGGDWTATLAALEAAGLRHLEATPPSPPPPPIWPPRGEVEAIWEAASAVALVSEGVVISTATTHFLELRGIDPLGVAHLDLARVLSPGFPGIAWFPREWRRRWPLILPTYDSRGDLRSLAARARERDVTPKSRKPLGFEARGLLLADPGALSVLRRESAEGIEGAVVVEGETDFLAASLAVHRERLPLAVFGGGGGSWSALAGVLWPEGFQFIVATDPDPTGEQNAGKIARAVRPRRAFRAELPEGVDVCDWLSCGATLAPLVHAALRGPPYALH